jgi:hypothetical protein
MHVLDLIRALLSSQSHILLQQIEGDYDSQ